MKFMFWTRRRLLAAAAGAVTLVSGMPDRGLA